MKKIKEKQKGITLIALVITIIVLLILAGVSIAMLTGNNGIITQANQAKNEIKEAENEEIERLENMNYNIDKFMYNVPIPNGFYYVGGNLETGIVISDNKNDKEKGDDYKSTVTLEGNQFVWIPVKTAVCSEVINLNDNNLKEEKINKIVDKINESSDKMGYPMSIKLVNGEEVEYVGVLYNAELKENVTDGKTTYSTEFTALPYSKINGDYREPDIANIADAYPKYLNLLNLKTIDEFEIKMHNDFNKMIESVEKYGGFYVSRYETTMSNSKEEKLESEYCFKQNREVIINKNWYEFYKIHMDYGKDKKSNIYSSTIWGTQWDQILLYMKDVKNEFDDNKPYIISGKGMCVENNGIISKSGSNEKYAVKNIFDMAGNVYEYTLETRSTTTHTKRSSCYQKGAINYANIRNYVIIKNDANKGSIYDGSRCSFYIE